MKVNKQFPAKGAEGFLLLSPDMSTAVKTGRKNRYGQDIVEIGHWDMVFRIYEYDENGKHKRDEKGGTIFKDYDIRHHDLKVKLLDGQFYETDEGDFLDYPGLRCYGSKTSDSDSPRLKDAEG